MRPVCVWVCVPQAASECEQRIARQQQQQRIAHQHEEARRLFRHGGAQRGGPQWEPPSPQQDTLHREIALLASLHDLLGHRAQARALYDTALQAHVHGRRCTLRRMAASDRGRTMPAAGSTGGDNFTAGAAAAAEKENCVCATWRVSYRRIQLQLHAQRLQEEAAEVLKRRRHSNGTATPALQAAGKNVAQGGAQSAAQGGAHCGYAGKAETRPTRSVPSRAPQAQACFVESAGFDALHWPSVHAPRRFPRPALRAVVGHP